jgi:AcrR family transcriptional regulator
VSPRRYSLGLREAAVDQTRERILAAARDVLSNQDRLTIDAVAQAADVVRMTVYNQFTSKGGLLNALFDWLAERGGMHQLAAAFQQSDPERALELFIATFCGFWASDRRVLRRLRALAVLDPELEAMISTRDGWRREGVRVLLRRRGIDRPEALDVLYALTSFETFDSLAGADRSAEQVTAIVYRMARAATAEWELPTTR